MHLPRVNGLPLPALLIDLMAQGDWKHPGDDLLRQVVPFLRDPVDFATSMETMRRESSGSLADDPRLSQVFHEVRGSRCGSPVDLPWLDVERAVLIAVNRLIGDDVAIALDYRTSMSDPRVVASDWWSSEGSCLWVVASETFSRFVEMLEL